MFDEITLEKQIKCKCGAILESFQTKSLEQAIQNYRIKDGILEIEIYKLVDPSKRNKYGFPKFIREHIMWYAVKQFSGILECHTICEKCKKFTSRKFNFAHGKLVGKNSKRRRSSK